MQGFRFPAAGDELAREPVEQLGVARAVAVLAKIVRRLDEAGAEVVLPDAIHGDAGGEWVRGRGEPARELGARSGGVGGQFGQIVAHEHGRRAWRDGLAFVVPIAALEHVDGCALRGFVADAEDRRRCRRERGLEVANLSRHALAVGALQIFQHAAEFVELGVEWFPFRLERRALRRRQEKDAVFLRGGKIRLQAVIVLLQDRIDFVVVAAGAADGQPEDGGADDVGALDEDFVAADGDVLVAGIAADRAEAVKPRGGCQLGIVRRDFVAGDLLGEKLVERFVAVQRVDHVVAEAPGFRKTAVILEALGLGEAHHVEPVAREMLAVVRTREQAIDDALVSVGRFVGEEGHRFLRCRRQAGEIEVNAAEELGLGRGGGGREGVRLQLCEHETINGAGGPRGLFHRGRRGGFHWLKRPVAASLLWIRGGVERLRLRTARIGRAHLDPAFEIRDHRGGELWFLRRHLQIGVLVADSLEKEALGVARDEDGAGVAAGEQAGLEIEAEVSAQFLRLGGMTVVALSAEDGLDFFAEEGVAGLELRRGVGGQREGGCAGERERVGGEAR